MCTTTLQPNRPRPQPKIRPGVRTLTGLTLSEAILNNSLGKQRHQKTS